LEKHIKIERVTLEKIVDENQKNNKISTSLRSKIAAAKIFPFHNQRYKSHHRDNEAIHENNDLTAGN
jgi:hypothetical protein